MVNKLHRLELKIPPVAVFLLIGLAMALPKTFLPKWSWGFPGKNVLAFGLYACGSLIAIAGIMAFRRACTTANPTTPEAARCLVRSGIYQISRNPMYLGLLLTLCGWAVTLGNPLTLPFLPIFVLYMNRFQIAPEERMLLKLFGAEYSVYQQSVRRWL